MVESQLDPFRVSRVLGLGFRCLGFRVQGLGFRVSGVLGLGFRCLGFRVLAMFQGHLDALKPKRVTITVPLTMGLGLGFEGL